MGRGESWGLVSSVISDKIAVLSRGIEDKTVLVVNIALATVNVERVVSYVSMVLTALNDIERRIVYDLDKLKASFKRPVADADNAIGYVYAFKLLTLISFLNMSAYTGSLFILFTYM